VPPTNKQTKMSIERELNKRSRNVNYVGYRKFEGVRTTTDKKRRSGRSIMTCAICKDQIENPGNEDLNHWRCLNDSMNENSAVQVVA
jgi:protein PhnA